MCIELRLPFPPTVNTYYRSLVMGKSVRVLISKDGRAYKDQVKAYLRAGRFPHLGNARLQVDVVVHAPDARERDLDNLSKALLDSLSDEFESSKDAEKAGRSRKERLVERPGIWRDDSQIDDYRLTRGAPVKGGAVVVFVQAIGLPPIAEQFGLGIAA